MDQISTFIASAMAGAILKEIATDTYKALKARLVEHFGLEASVATLEHSPDDEDAREFMAKKLSKTEAIKDATVLDAAEQIATELEKLPNDTALGAKLTVRDIRASSAKFRRNSILSGGVATFGNMDIKEELIVEDNVVGDDRKR